MSDPFALQFDRLEYWREARVVAATAREVPASAVELALALRSLARSIGLEPDDRPLRPHLTLMRGVNPLAWQMAGRMARIRAGLRADLASCPSELHLAESRASERSAVGRHRSAARRVQYVSLASWPLGH